MDAFLRDVDSLSGHQVEGIFGGITQSDVSRWQRGVYQRLTEKKRAALLGHLENRQELEELLSKPSVSERLRREGYVNPLDPSKRREVLQRAREAAAELGLSNRGRVVGATKGPRGEGRVVVRTDEGPQPEEVPGYDVLLEVPRQMFENYFFEIRGRVLSDDDAIRLAADIIAPLAKYATRYTDDDDLEQDLEESQMAVVTGMMRIIRNQLARR